MIYTVTFNPSLDYILSTPPLKLGATNRADATYILSGGKGINVSTVLHNLGIDSTALGFTAGFTGEEIQRKVAESGVKSNFIELENGTSRINEKVRPDGTEINASGPEIPSDKLEQLLAQLDKLRAGDILVLAGSIPASLPATMYQDIMKQLQHRGVLVVVDAEKELLMNVLPYHPFLIKPNHHELGELFGTSFHAREEVVPFARKLQEQGALNVLVSLASQGAVLVDAIGCVHMSPAPEGELVNGVGAGDSMVAGFLAGWLQTSDYEHAFHMGLAAGSASACSENLAEKREIEVFYEQLRKL